MSQTEAYVFCDESCCKSLRILIATTTLWRAGKITAVNAIALTGLSASSFYRMAAKRKEKE